MHFLPLVERKTFPQRGLQNGIHFSGGTFGFPPASEAMHNSHTSLWSSGEHTTKIDKQRFSEKQADPVGSGIRSMPCAFLLSIFIILPVDILPGCMYLLCTIHITPWHNSSWLVVRTDLFDRAGAVRCGVSAKGKRDPQAATYRIRALSTPNTFLLFGSNPHV